MHNAAVMIPFGDAVRAVRKSLGIRQEDLADKIGMQRSYLSKVEGGKVRNPTVETRRQIADGLGLTLDELMEQAQQALAAEMGQSIGEYELTMAFLAALGMSPDDPRAPIIELLRRIDLDNPKTVVRLGAIRDILEAMVTRTQ